ncbi:phosphotransferase [Pedococcus bigeumensis]|uniref:2'-phosphotransferase n=1 Tax=Pedococcus bigeumensis TaxID=433644 RepID=A0A502CW51_9MICO|nr:phosphotransferase [Pedococcus bigeumensis]TPG15971.1 2'-phosphotransferase [Pedococcus bigeumensis]
MDRSPLFLAALASAAVPGLDPASVEALPGAPDHHYDVAFVQDTQHRRWVVRVPRSQVAAAQMESTFGLLALLARRLPFSVPTPKGFAALKEGGRAAIYPYLPGQNVDFAQLPAGAGLAAELGRAIAALHNADHGLFDEAGLPAYDADTYRTRRLSELDRAAATGHVPTGLLARWEKLLEDVTLWRFAPTPTHGDLTGDQVLAVFDDDDDAATGRVKALTGWEDAKVADPADDFFALVTQTSPRALETLMEAYAHARAERPDVHLLTRAQLSAEMRTLSQLMSAVSGGDRLQVERHALALRRLDERVHAEEEAANDYRRAGMTPARRKSPVLVPPVVVEDEDDDEDDVEVMFAPTADDHEAPGRDSGAEHEATDHEPADRDEARDEDKARDGDDEPAFEDDADELEDLAGDEDQAEELEDDGEAQFARVDHDVTAEIDLSQLRAPQSIEGDDPGPEFEPGYRPRA